MTYSKAEAVAGHLTHTKHRHRGRAPQVPLAVLALAPISRPAWATRLTPGLGKRRHKDQTPKSSCTESRASQGYTRVSEVTIKATHGNELTTTPQAEVEDSRSLVACLPLTHTSTFRLRKVFVTLSMWVYSTSSSRFFLSFSLFLVTSLSSTSSFCSCSYTDTAAVRAGLSLRTPPQPRSH